MKNLSYIFLCFIFLTMISFPSLGQMGPSNAYDGQVSMLCNAPGYTPGPPNDSYLLNQYTPNTKVCWKISTGKSNACVTEIRMTGSGSNHGLIASLSGNKQAFICNDPEKNITGFTAKASSTDKDFARKVCTLYWKAIVAE